MKNNLLNSNLTILVNTCDSYHDVLSIFFLALKSNWPDCPYSVVINTETSTYNYPARVHRHTGAKGRDDWGARLRSTLQAIESDYVMMLCDDFILNAPVSNLRVAQALALLQLQSDAIVVYLIDTALPLSCTDTQEEFIPLKVNSEYLLNTAPAIWRKQALMHYTSAGDTPWAWEVFGTYRTWGTGDVFYSLNPSVPDIYPYDHDKGGAIYRGKWVRKVVDQVSNKFDLNIDWTLRGYSSNDVDERRSLSWKYQFMKTGFRMVGFKALYFLKAYFSKFYHV